MLILSLFAYDVAEDKLKVDANGRYIEVKDDSPGLASNENWSKCYI